MKSERDYATEIIANAPGPRTTIIELGAHHGNDTVLLYDAAVTPLTYVAVEADPRNVPVLERRIEGRRVNILHAAVSDGTGEVTLYLSEGNGTGSSSIREPLKHLEYFPDISFRETVQVPALTLDAIAACYAIGPVDLIWCDIQGAERNMLAGGRQTLTRTSWLLTECDQVEMYAGQATRDELLEILGREWEIVAEWPENANLLLRNRALA
jgi:FkbM family methyltransferase